MTIFFWLMVGHALCDFALQSDAMARGKNRHVTPTNVPPGQTLQVIWPYWLTSHALIHGGMVALVTGSVWLGLAESVLHTLIDYAKCAGRTTINQDQALHVICKVAWAVLA